MNEITFLKKQIDALNAELKETQAREKEFKDLCYSYLRMYEQVSRRAKTLQEAMLNQINENDVQP